MSSQRGIAAPAGGASHGAVPLWRNRDYLLLLGGQIVSAVGTGVSQLAFPLLILAITHSPALAGLLGAFRLVPYLLLSLPSGALVDRWDRRRTMLVCDAGRALALASIPLAAWAHRLGLVQLFAVALIEGTLFVFFNLAESAAVPRVVPREQLPAATAANELTFSTQLLLGPPLGGALFAVAQSLPFLADAMSYLLSVLSLSFIHIPSQPRRASEVQSLRTDIAEGIAWLWRSRLLRFMALMTGIGSFVLPGTALIVIVQAQRLHATSFAIGAIFAAGGVGGLLGAGVSAVVQRRVSFGRSIIATGWLYALLLPLYALAGSPLALGAVMAAVAVVDSPYNVVQFAYRRALIPDELQGRVNGVFRLILFSFESVGLAVTGLLLQRVGVVPSILLLSACMAAIAVAATLNPDVRYAPPLHTGQTS